MISLSYSTLDFYQAKIYNITMSAGITNKQIYQEIVSFKKELTKQYQIKSVIALAALVSSVVTIIFLHAAAFFLPIGIVLIVVASLALCHYANKHLRETNLLKSALKSLFK